MSSERQLLTKNDPWWGEHVHRYHEILPHLKPNDNILDLACGTGFGSNILAQHTKGLVVGGDIAAEAITDCRANWSKENLKFEVLDGTALRYPDAYFDKVVSFETIEHTTQYREMLREFHRVLKPGSFAFISTPNFPVNSPSGKVTNPYHTQEFIYPELDAILRDVFSDVKILGQRYSRYDDGKTNKIGILVEGAFNTIGIRKLPPGVKNSVTRFFVNKPFFPTADDYSMVAEMDKLLKCKTFFCICRK